MSALEDELTASKAAREALTAAIDRLTGGRAVDDPTADLLRISLLAAVPLWALQMRWMEWSDLTTIADDCAQTIAAHGDLLMYRSKTRGGTAKAFNALAKGLAIASFVPGGITFLGDHWENPLTMFPC